MLKLPIQYNGQLDSNWNTYVNFIERSDNLLELLPERIENLFLDYETTSGKINVKSTNPHRDCSILGFSFCFDDCNAPFYVPVRHAYLDDNDIYCYRTGYMENTPVEIAHRYLQEIFRRTENWWNQNIKYDVHVGINELGLFPKCILWDTLTILKLCDIEERFEYGLTSMMKIFGKDIEPYEEKLKQFLGRTYKDYALVPPDVMSIYGGVDVLSIQFIRGLLEKILSPEVQRIVQTEMALLPELIKIEQIGTRANPEKIISDWKEIIPRQEKRITRIKELTGYMGFDPSVKESLREMFQEVLGWELDWTAKSVEKYEKGLITEDDVTYSTGYASIMKHRNKNQELVDTYIAYQEDQKLLTSFTIPYLERHLDPSCLMHATINQMIRTGRMSVGDPNLTQCSPEAKEYIIPYSDDYILVDFDLSQIEFRVIAHYISNKRTVEAFQNDPSTDFHTWVSKLCGIPRKPAKNVNFMLGYGGGMKKCVAMLSEHPDIIRDLTTSDLIHARALQVYRTYHQMLPELKQTSYRCGDVLKARGFVRTLLGRRLHKPKQFFYKSFNAVCQGSAADIMKDITLRLRQFMSIDCILHMIVHDSWLFSIKKNRVHELIPLMKAEIEKPIQGVKFDVPIVSGVDCSEKNWRLCDKDQRKLMNEPSYLEFQNA